jgi:hypothetical protein
MLSVFQPAFARVATKKEPIISTSEIPDKTGKTISCLLALRILKLLFANFQPFERRSKKFM